jgi:hypothetical protein
MEGRQEGVEPLHRAHDLSSLSGEVEAVARGDRSMQQCPAGRATTCPPGSRHAVVGRTLPSGAAIRGHWPGYRHQSGHVPDSVPSGRQSLPKHRTVNPPIAPTRYNFLHASSKPALRPGDDTTVTGAPAPPSTQVEPYASGNPERRNRRGLGQHPPLRTGQLPHPSRPVPGPGHGQSHARAILSRVQPDASARPRPAPSPRNPQLGRPAPWPPPPVGHPDQRAAGARARLPARSRQPPPPLGRPAPAAPCSSPAPARLARAHRSCRCQGQPCQNRYPPRPSPITSPDGVTSAPVMATPSRTSKTQVARRRSTRPSWRAHPRRRRWQEHMPGGGVLGHDPGDRSGQPRSPTDSSAWPLT